MPFQLRLSTKLRSEATKRGGVLAGNLRALAKCPNSPFVHRPSISRISEILVKDCVTVPGLVGRNRDDGTSYTWIYRGRRSPRRRRRRAPRPAKRRWFAKSDWLTPVLLDCGDHNFICPATSDCVAACDLNAWGDDLPGLDHAY